MVWSACGESTLVLGGREPEKTFSRDGRKMTVREKISGVSFNFAFCSFPFFHRFSVSQNAGVTGTMSQVTN